MKNENCKMKMDGEAVRYFSICIIHYSFINCSRLLLACIVALIVGCTGRGDATPAASSVGVAESQQREVAQRLFDSAVEMLNRLDSYDQGGVEVPVRVRRAGPGREGAAMLLLLGAPVAGGLLEARVVAEDAVEIGDVVGRVLLDERSRQAITHFYASTPVTPMIAPGPLAERGAALYAKNCARCHQADARGAEGFPRLAGQQQDYLRINLKRYLTQSGERLYTPMTAAVTMLGQENFEAVTQYLASLK